VNKKLTLSAYVGYTQGQINPKGKDGKFGYLELFQRLLPLLEMIRVP
jgi:hypothetical protein